MAFVIALLTCWGAAWIIVRSKAGALVRVPLAHVPVARDMVQCGGCTGFWCGLFYGVALTDESGLARLACAGILALASAGTCAVLDATYLYLRGVE